jgi:hypothetical protein
MKTSRTGRSPIFRLHRIFAGSLMLALLLQMSSAAARPKTIEELERDFARENDQRKRARIALELLDRRLDAIRDFVSTGTMLEPENDLLPPYVETLDRLDKAVTAAAHAGTSKRVELGLRRHAREMEQVRMNVSVAERPLVEDVSARLEKVREKVLYSIMSPKKK